MRKRMLIAAGALAAFGIAGQADAQTSGIPLSVEVRGGAAFPTGDFGDVAETGVGYGANAALNLTPLFGVYGGYSRSEFGVEVPSGVNADANLVDSGFNGGIIITPGSQAFRGLSPWLRAGAVYRKIESDTDVDLPGGNISFERESDSQVGFEVGGGLDFPLGQVISITPGVRYTAYSLGDDNGTIDTDFNVNYVTVDVGLRFRF